MKAMQRKSILLGAILASGLAFSLSSCTCIFWCHDDMAVQRDYVEDRDMCQSEAEKKVGLYIKPGQRISSKERNSMLLAMFAECMHAKDWGVTAPKTDDGSGGGGEPPIDTARPGYPVEGPGYGGPEVTTRARTAPGGVIPPEQPQPAPVPPRDGPLVGTGVGPGYGSPQPTDPTKIPRYTPRETGY
jgi:hypothetical protein